VLKVLLVLKEQLELKVQ